MSSRLFACALVALAACAPRGELAYVPEVPAEASVHRLFTVTSREATVPGFFGSFRAGQAGFTHFDVSVPPNRETGTVTYSDHGSPDPMTHFVTQDWADYSTAAAWQAGIDRALRQLPPDQRDVTVFVHGFNSTFAEGLYRAAQMQNDFGIDGVMTHYAWPSAGNPLNYAYDRDSVLFARDGLEQMLRTLSRTSTNRISIVAHSMGSLLTMETLRSLSLQDPGWVGRNIDGVVLIAPDIDPGIFIAQASDIGTLPQDFVLMTSKKDKALKLSARLTGQTSRLGNIGNVDSIADLPITVVDVTSFSSGLGHSTGMNSPALISIISRAPEIDEAFQNSRGSRAGLIPGTVLTVQNATEIILSPVSGSGLGR